MAPKIIGERTQCLLINYTGMTCFPYEKEKKKLCPSSHLTKKSIPDGKKINVKGKALNLPEG